MVSKRAILVTGSHRSGSTWVGRMIAEAPGIFYIHEPFSVSDPPGPGICNIEFKRWFTCITHDNDARFYEPLKNMLALRYNLTGALTSVKSMDDLKRVKAEYRQFAAHRRQGSTPLIKDPVAFFSSEWLAEKFDMAVVVVIRHPAAFVSSIKKLNWSHPFSHFLEQPLLLENMLQDFETEIREYAAREHGIIDQAILLWKLIYGTCILYQRRHKKMIFVRHEDLSRNPLDGFKSLCRRLNLTFSKPIETAINQYSAPTNPIDPNAHVGSEITLMRNSGLNIWNWKNRLTSSEISKVRNRVEDISSAFYSDDDW